MAYIIEFASASDAAQSLELSYQERLAVDSYTNWINLSGFDRAFEAGIYNREHGISGQKGRYIGLAITGYVHGAQWESVRQEVQDVLYRIKIPGEPSELNFYLLIGSIIVIVVVLVVLFLIVLRRAAARR